MKEARRYVLLLISIIAVFSNLVAGANRVSLLGHLDKPHGISGQKTSYSACWGWVSPTGKEYALVGTYTGMSIIDLNGDSLREVQFIPGPPAAYAYREIKTYKHYAYIVSEGGSGIQIVDLAGLPDTAILVKNFIYTSTTPPDSGKTVFRSHTVTEADGYLYCNGSSSWSPSGCIIFSLREDPTTPTFVGQFQPTPSNPSSNYIHDSYARNDTLLGAAIYSGGGLYIVDVHDKTNPVVIAKIVYTGSGTHHAWRSIDGQYAFTTDEIGSSGQNLKVWDISSLPSYSLVTTYRASPDEVIHNVHGRGNYLYVSHYKAGMRVVDVHDPRNPVEVGFYDTYSPNPDTVPGPYAGCWGVFPYFPSGKWIGSDMESGLYVCTFDSLKPRVRPRLAYPPDSILTSGFSFRWTLAADQKNDPHYYEVHILGASGDTIYQTTDTNFVPILPSFMTDGWYTWFVTVRDEFTEVTSQDTFHFHYVSPVSVHEKQSVPFSFSLEQNYPNPFNPMTKIEFTLQTLSDVSLKIYNALGQELYTLLDHQQLGMGKHEVVFDASRLASGTYFYRLITAKFTETKAMILSR